MNRVFLRSTGLPWQRLQNPVPQTRTRRMMAFTFNLPLVGWWAVFLGTIAFGCLLNVYKTYRIAESRIQLARIELEYTRQQQINTELLYRIGEEVDLNQVYFWAVKSKFIPQHQTIWLNPSPPLATTLAPVQSSPQGRRDAPPSADERIQTVSKHIDILGIGLQEQLMEWVKQLEAFSLMPPEIHEVPPPLPPEDETRSFWQRLLDSANVASP